MKLSNTLMINESLLPSTKKAFTLAEVLITLSILGVVAALTIPNLVNRQSDIAAQTKLKKAITNYHDVVEVYMIENEALSAANMFTTGCPEATQYFKISEQDSTNGCIFKTADGARWEFDPATGNAVVTDSGALTLATDPRYAVVLWNAQGFVNSDQCNDSEPATGGTGKYCGTNVAPPALTLGSQKVINGVFNAKEFITATGAELKSKNTTTARTGVAQAVASGTPGTKTTTELKHAIAAVN